MLHTLFLPLLYFSKGVVSQSSPSDATVQCREGWYQYVNYCYKLSDTKVVWDTARDRCEDEGAHLASIHSKDELDFLITYMLLTRRQGVYIGINDKERSGTHVWPDGTPVDYTNWDGNEPTLRWNDRLENCGEMRFNAENINRMGKWNDLICDHSLFYICKMPSDPSLSSPNPKYCSEGGYKLHESCLTYVSTPRSWSDAEDFCRTNHGGHLLAVQDSTYQFFTSYILKEMDLISPLWIGIKATSRGQVQKWSSGWLLLYNKWTGGVSQDKLRNGDCVARLRTGSWDVRPCDRKYSFICEANSVQAPILKPTVEGSYCPKVPSVLKDLGGDYCYYYNDVVDITWHEANFDCVRNGGTLASIHSEDEARSIEQLLRYKIRDIFFIGLFRRYDDNFAWMDGSEVTYTAFDQGEPSNVREKCSELRTVISRWHDFPCDGKRGYLCSVRKILPDGVGSEDVMCSGELLTVD